VVEVLGTPGGKFPKYRTVARLLMFVLPVHVSVAVTSRKASLQLEQVVAVLQAPQLAVQTANRSVFIKCHARYCRFN